MGYELALLLEAGGGPYYRGSEVHASRWAHVIAGTTLGVRMGEPCKAATTRLARNGGLVLVWLVPTGAAIADCEYVCLQLRC